VKSYLFTTDTGRGGVILSDIDSLEAVVPYLQQRFAGVVRVEQGLTQWTLEGGFEVFTPVPVEQVFGGASAQGDSTEQLKATDKVLNQASPLDGIEKGYKAPVDTNASGELF